MNIGRKWLWILPVLWIIGFSIAHPLLNAHYARLLEHPGDGREFFRTKDDGEIWEARGNELAHHTGSWLWRFSHWGLRRGDISAQTPFGWLLRGIFGVSIATASAVDITNPTPALVFLVLILIALLGNRKKRVDASNSSTSGQSGAP